MFSNIEGFALLFLMRAADEEERSAHSLSVVRELDLDPRLAPLIPLRPRRGRPLEAYERVLEGLALISALPEPERTSEIEQLAVAVRSARK